MAGALNWRPAPRGLTRGDDRAKRRIAMAKGQVRSNREAKKPKKEKPKEAAGAPGLLKAGTPGKKK
jgi:hypothetical protein